MVKESCYLPWAHVAQDRYHPGGQGDQETRGCREIEGVIEGWSQHTVREVDLKGRVVLDRDGVGEDSQTHHDAREEQE